MSKVKILFLSIFISFVCSAQDTSLKLAEVVVTANKYPKKQTQTGKVITVIDQQMLQQLRTRTLGEILNTVAGVTINGANNNLGTNQGVSLRGTAFGNTLILIDGIPANDPSVISNYFDINFLMVDEIEKIEVLKGGQSTLYGSDAVAGVINIITKKAVAKPLVFNSTISAGSYNTYRLSSGISGSINKFSYKLQYGAVSSRGFSAAHDSTGVANFDRDNYRNNVITGRIIYALTPTLSVNASSNYSRYKTDLDAAAFTDDDDFTSTNNNFRTGVGFMYKQSLGQLVFNYSFQYTDRLYLDDSIDRSNSFAYFSNSKYIGRTHFAELYNNWKWTNIELLAGADYRFNNTDQKFYSVGSFGPFETMLDDSLAHVHQISPYTSIVYSPKNWNIELGGRYNNHSEYGSNVTYTLNPSYLINNRLKLFTNVSSAFKAPSLYQLYDAYAGNKNLKPETSTTFESGIEVHGGKGFNFRATYFHLNIKDAIVYIIVDPSTFESKYSNVNKQKNYGLELETSFRSDNWSVKSNYTYTQSKATTEYSESGFMLVKDTTYNNLYRVPKSGLNVFATYNITNKWNAGIILKYSGERLEPVYLSKPVILDDYLTIDVSTTFIVNRHLSIFADFKNISNKRYFDIVGYNSRRFNYNGGVSIKL
jgi:vitamin B12 transporter